MAATEELKYLDNERAQELIDETKKRIKAVQKQVYKPGGKIGSSGMLMGKKIIKMSNILDMFTFDLRFCPVRHP